MNTEIKTDFAQDSIEQEPRNRNVQLITCIKVTKRDGTEVILDGGRDTAYNGPPDKAADHFQSRAFEDALSRAMQNAKVRDFIALEYEIKHKKH